MAYRNSIKEIAVLTDTNLNHGLSQSEAENDGADGANELVEEKRKVRSKSFWNSLRIRW